MGEVDRLCQRLGATRDWFNSVFATIGVSRLELASDGLAQMVNRLRTSGVLAGTYGSAADARAFLKVWPSVL